MLYPLIYKRSSTGAIVTWQRETKDNKYRTISGQETGAKVTTEWTVCEPKNVGRSNETSAEEQAYLETEAAYKKKLAQGGYFSTREEVDNEGYFKPMLAQDYNKRPLESFNRVYSQPKLDGARCIAKADGLWSRQGKPILSAPHIHEALLPLFERDSSLIFDGELYADPATADFNKIMSLTKKKDPTDKQLIESAEIVEYHVYDLPSTKGNFFRRHVELLDLLLELDSCIKTVETTSVNSAELLDRLNVAYLASGYEGQMVRLDGEYKNGRSWDLMKRKVFIDEEYEIVSINEGKGNRSGKAGFITYKRPDGVEFDSGIKGSFEYATQLLEDADKYVGGQGTVRYFELTPDGIPRFPITVHVYEGKRDV